MSRGARVRTCEASLRMASSCRRRISGVPGQLPLAMAGWAEGGWAKGSSRFASTSVPKNTAL